MNNDFVIAYLGIIPNAAQQWLTYAQIVRTIHAAATAIFLMYTHILVGILSSLNHGYIYMISHGDVIE